MLQVPNLVKSDLVFNERLTEFSVDIYKKPKTRKIVINSRKLDSYFTPNYSNEEIEDLIIKLLDEWKMK